MSEETTNLKPCPACGRDAADVRKLDLPWWEKRWQARCRYCLCYRPPFMTRRAAIREWNQMRWREKE